MIFYHIVFHYFAFFSYRKYIPFAFDFSLAFLYFLVPFTFCLAVAAIHFQVFSCLCFCYFLPVVVLVAAVVEALLFHIATRRLVSTRFQCRAGPTTNFLRQTVAFYFR